MTPAESIFEIANDAKANFDDVYNLPDPRRYYRTLGALDYRIPTEAAPVFKRVLEAIDIDRPKIVDVGCSYGVNAAMIRYDLDFAELVARYRKASMATESVAEAIFRDAAFFADKEPAVDATFAGVDIAHEALGYARSVGLIDRGVAENLEAAPLSAEGAAAVSGVDLVITTGAVGYVTAETFTKIINAADGRPPCVAAFALRQFPFGDIAAELEAFGLTTEKLEGRYFPQRRFIDAEEQSGAIAAAEALGLDTEGLESEGAYYAEFYLAAPADGPRLKHLGI